MVILLFFALLSGLVTVFSPCILPVLPIVLSTSTAEGRSKPLGMITGLIISFSVFTLVITKLVSLLNLSATWLRDLSVVLLILIGLTMLNPAATMWTERVLSIFPRLTSGRRLIGSGYGQGLLLGASLGLIWAPCAGPILAAVTVIAATQPLTLNTFLVILFYSIGAGIPLLAIAYGGRALIRRMPLLTRNLLGLQRVFGAIVIATAILIGLNYDTLLTVWLTDRVPAAWSTAIDSFESSAQVQRRLATLNGATAPADRVPSSGPRSASSGLPYFGIAKDMTGITHWINSDPLTLSQLKGKVVLVDFWTYTCINCIRTFPYLKDWYAKYKDSGFIIIGVHTPEFAFEHETPNVEQAVQRFGILYPVAQDNNYATWDAYNNSYWPAEYLIDANGFLRHFQFGEGNYDETEKAIQDLLAEAGHPVTATLTSNQSAAVSTLETPETYLGTDLQARFASPETSLPDVLSVFSFPDSLPLHNFAVSGSWEFTREYAQEHAAGTRLELHFFAKDAYLVMNSDQPATVTVESLTPNVSNGSEDVDPQGRITITAARLYHLVHFNQAMEGTIVLNFNTADVRLYSFTFGS